MRFTEEEVDLEKFRMDPKKPMLADQEEEITAYRIDGILLDDPASPACLAKAIKQPGTNTTSYSVLFNNVGPNASLMVDPDDESQMNRRGDWTAHGRCSFRNVEQEAFDLYLRFLKTKNKANYHDANRKVMR